jgi:PAS domain S-box-containing protein
VSTALAESERTEERLDAAARLMVPQLADWCAFDLGQDGGDTERVAVSHADEEKSALAQRPGAVGMGHAAIVPLRGKDRTLGALTLVSAESGRRLGPREVAVATEIARRSALAIENAGLLRERKEAAEQLGDAFALLDAIFERVPVGLAFFDGDLRYVRVNEWLAEINGIPAPAHIGLRVHDVLPDMAEPVEAALRDVRDRGRALVELELFGVTPAQPDAHREWLVSYWPVRADGRTIGLGCVVIEMTERRAAERALREQTDRYETLMLALSEVGEGMVVIQDDHVVYANQALQTMSGYGFDELIALESVFDLVVPEDREGARTRAIERISDDTVDPHYTLRLRHRDGRMLDLEVAGVPLTIGERQQLVVVVRDISARRRAEAERERLLELEQSARAEAERAHAGVSFLAALGAALEQALDVVATLEAAARVAVREQATTCLAVLGEPGPNLRRLPGVARDPATEALLRDVQRENALEIAAGRPIGQALRTGRIVRLDQVTDDMLREAAEDEEHLRRLRAVGFGGMLFLPLKARGRTLGALAVGFAEPLDGAHGDEVEALFRTASARIALAVDNARLYEERSHIARTLQRSLLPPELPHVPGVELAARYRPAGEGNEVGGDFYDCFALGGGEWAVVIGDVCGKGAEAAAVTALARYTIRASVLHDRRPVAVLSELNEAIRRQGLEYRFATVLYARLRMVPEGLSVTLGVGGHPLPLVLHADGRVHTAGRPGTLLGILPQPKLAEETLLLEPGAALVLYTDGVIEASPLDDAFGTERFTEFLAGCAGRKAAEIAEAIERAVVEVQNGKARDDVALLVLRVPEAAEPFGSAADGVSATA